MKTFEIYQVGLTDAMCRILNSGGTTPKCQAHRDMSLAKNLEQHFRDGHYDRVALIEAANLNDVFRVGNIGPEEGSEESLRRLGPMHSISVGDIIVDEDGIHHTVEMLGFSTINPKGE